MSSIRYRRAQAEAERAARWAGALTRLSLILISFLLNGDFHPDLLPGGEGSNFQQYLGLTLWVTIIVATLYLPPLRQMEGSFGIYANWAFYTIAIASAAWSANVESSMMKSAAMLIVLAGAWRLTLTFPWEELLACVQHGLFSICLFSTLMAIFVPSIGVMSDYLHAGQWSGLFASKQTLGFCSDMLLYLSTFRLMNDRRNRYSWIGVALAILCLIGSGSRGSGVLAVAAVLATYAMRKWRALGCILAFVPFILTLIGALLISYLLYTQNRFVVIGGAWLDFTQRTYIWQHALRFFWDAPWFGFGVNGFWTQRNVKDLFLERYQWFLDNYHSGYIAILMETGLVGYILFAIAGLCFALRMNRLVRGRALPERQTSFAIIFACLLYIIDFTETYFMRSTNLRTTMLAIVTALAFSRPLLPSPCRGAGDLDQRRKVPPLRLRRGLASASEWM
ncbi:O-antigen ligase family protein [Methylocystis echinoides]|uniref:Ligase n=1 Tax=Methylocystis echinoides TaxID=29468 RepID=A0A9W6LS33_9HYPH|nr:O-antigen ligase family protein [Methylocystis echinoides]GLI92934.1 ligase [Methylocystis echinoides]